MDGKKNMYLPHVDGLRAIAVLLVVFYHFDLLFTGGFIGVDIFFVISGYLITRLIKHELSNQSFSYKNFYLRRFRRLAPAMVFTVLLVLIASAICFRPQEFQRQGGAIASALFFVSNFYFWRESGYFDTEVGFKPLQHFWSLSVEEQFYFIWPVLIIYLLKKQFGGMSLFVSALISLVLCQSALEMDPSAAFYLMPLRFYEFAIGGLLVWSHNNNKETTRTTEYLWLTGLAIIIYCGLSYTPDDFPGMKALLPCIGTAMVIYGGHSKNAGYILKNKLMVGIGLISYSLYLIHWPVYVFVRYYQVDNLSLGMKSFLIAFSIIAAVIMYFFIETPFRKVRGYQEQRLPIKLIATFSMITLIISSLGIHSYYTGGWPWRISMANPIAENYKKSFFTDWNCSQRDGQSFGHCSNGKIEVGAIGDSHLWSAYHFLNKLSADSYTTFKMHHHIDCRPGDDCTDHDQKSLDEMPYEKILLVSNWMNVLSNSGFDAEHPRVQQFFRELSTIIDRFAQRKQQVWIYGVMPSYEIGLEACFDRPIFTPEGCHYRKPKTFEQQLAFNQALKKMVLSKNGRYFDIFDLLCNQEGLCQIAHNSRPFYSDQWHLHKFNFGAFAIMTKKSSLFDDMFDSNQTPKIPTEHRDTPHNQISADNNSRKQIVLEINDKNYTIKELSEKISQKVIKLMDDYINF
ncbi:MAG: hypothetical protein CMP10_18360, partial [Zetaproteobacteria bacterium]|nr:hypothetical protein [Pseudobdellovibrionaceae bacterium]